MGENRKGAQEGEQAKARIAVSMRKLMKNVNQKVKGYVEGKICLLQGPKQSSTTGMALKGLRGW